MSDSNEENSCDNPACDDPNCNKEANDCYNALVDALNALNADPLSELIAVTNIAAIAASRIGTQMYGCREITQEEADAIGEQLFLHAAAMVVEAVSDGPADTLPN